MERMSLNDSILYAQLNLTLLEEADAKNSAERSAFTSRNIAVPQRLINRQHGIALQKRNWQRRLEWLQERLQNRQAELEAEAKETVKLTIHQLNGGRSPKKKREVA